MSSSNHFWDNGDLYFLRYNGHYIIIGLGDLHRYSSLLSGPDLYSILKKKNLPKSLCLRLYSVSLHKTAFQTVPSIELEHFLKGSTVIWFFRFLDIGKSIYEESWIMCFLRISFKIFAQSLKNLLKGVIFCKVAALSFATPLKKRLLFRYFSGILSRF